MMDGKVTAREFDTSLGKITVKLTTTDDGKPAVSICAHDVEGCEVDYALSGWSSDHAGQALFDDFKQENAEKAVRFIHRQVGLLAEGGDQ